MSLIGHYSDQLTYLKVVPGIVRPIELPSNCLTYIPALLGLANTLPLIEEEKKALVQGDLNSGP